MKYSSAQEKAFLLPELDGEGERGEGEELFFLFMKIVFMKENFHREENYPKNS